MADRAEACRGGRGSLVGLVPQDRPVEAITGRAMAAAMRPPTAEMEMRLPMMPVLVATLLDSTASGYVPNGAHAPRLS